MWVFHFSTPGFSAPLESWSLPQRCLAWCWPFRVRRSVGVLQETEADKLCRKLELKDHVPCQMQRLTKYPMLIENLMKYTQSSKCSLSVLIHPAAKLVSKAHKRDHVQPLLQALLWLPIQARIDYKLCVITSSLSHLLPTSLTFSLCTPLPGSFALLQTTDTCCVTVCCCFCWAHRGQGFVKLGLTEVVRFHWAAEHRTDVRVTVAAASSAAVYVCARLHACARVCIYIYCGW